MDGIVFPSFLPGQLPGTVTNDNAPAGDVGEVITSSVVAGSAIGIGSGTAGNITSLPLTAGDWDVWGNVVTAPGVATTMAALSGWMGTASAAQPTMPNGGGIMSLPIAIAAGVASGGPVGMMRQSLAAPATVYLGVLATFAVSTMGAYGSISARRAR